MKKRGRNFSESAFRVAGERLVLPGKIQVPVFPTEISTSHWEESSFSFKNKSRHTFRFIKMPSNGIQSADAKNLLSGISFITEINLD